MHRMYQTRGTRVGGLLVASAVLFASALLLATAATARAEPAVSGLPAQVNAMTWNICGASASSCEGKGSAAQKLDRVMQRVEEDPTLTAIALQEVCEDAHANALRDRLGNGWRVNFRAAPKMGEAAGSLNRCTLDGTQGQAAGVLVALKAMPGTGIGQIEEADEQFHGVPHANDTAGSPTQGAACLRDTVNKLMACSAHFPFAESDEAVGTEYDTRLGCSQQYGALGGEWRAKGWRTVLGGDLNLNGRDSEREQLRHLYDGGNFEADQLNRPTTPGFIWLKKLDYLFFSDGNWKLRGAAVDSSAAIQGLSDHYLLKGTVSPV